MDALSTANFKFLVGANLDGAFKRPANIADSAKLTTFADLLKYL